MKRFNDIITTGFPETIESWDFIAKQNAELHQLITNIVSNDTCILTGCEFTEVGTDTAIANGIVCYQGKLYSVIGGVFETNNLANVRVNFSTATATGYPEPQFQFEAFGRLVYLEDKATLQIGLSGIAINSLKRVPKLTDSQFVIGMVIEWEGLISEVPNGWAICDGTNGTSNRGGRVSVGYDASNPLFNDIGKIGGVHEWVMTEAQLPAHLHTKEIIIPPTNLDLATTAGTDSGGGFITTGSGTEGSISLPVSESIDLSGDTSTVGQNEPINNMQPYFVVCKIKYIGI